MLCGNAEMVRLFENGNSSNCGFRKYFYFLSLGLMVGFFEIFPFLESRTISGFGSNYFHHTVYSSIFMKFHPWFSYDMTIFTPFNVSDKDEISMANRVI